MATTATVTGRLITDQRLISSYNRGPITSVFALPASCTATLTFTDGPVAGFGGLYYGHSGSIFDNRCFPTANSVPASIGDNWGIYYYSPAICPSGWTADATFASSWPVYPFPDHVSIGSETTAALCCPSGYVLYQDGHQCSSTVTAGQKILLYSYAFTSGSWARGTPITYSFLSATAVKGDGIPIWWQSSDSALLARASAMTPTPSPSALVITIEASPRSAATSAIPSSSNSSTPTEPPPPGGLSTGAKIGIGIGIPLAVIAAVLAGFLLWKRRQKRQIAHGSRAELDGGNTEFKDTPTEGTNQFYELHTSPEAYHNRHELPDVPHR